MKPDYCKLTEDLLPLYIDKLVSPETETFIDDHLKQCEGCRKKLAELTSDVLPPVSPPADNAKPDPDTDAMNTEDPKYEHAKQFLNKIHRRLRFAVSAILIMFLVICLASFWHGRSYYSEKPLKVDSSQDYAEQVIPGWARADRAGQLIDLQITQPIPGTKAEVTFEKAWFTQKYTYILYTVKDPDKKYYLARNSVIDVPPESYVRNNLQMYPYGRIFGGISSSGVHDVLIFMGYKSPVPSKSLTLTISQWIQGPFPPSYDNYNYIEAPVEITLPLSDAYLQEPSESVALDQEFSWREHRVKLTQLDVSLSKTILHGEFTMLEGEEYPNLEAYLKAGEQIAYLTFDSLTPTSTPNTYQFTAHANALNEWPATIEFHVLSMNYYSPDSLKFPLQWADYKDKRGEEILFEGVPEATQTFFDGEVKLYKLTEDGFNITISPPSGSLQKYPIVLNANSIFKIAFEPGDSGLRVINEQGEMAPFYSFTGSGNFKQFSSTMRFSFEWDDPFWQNSEQITIEFNQPMVEMLINESRVIYSDISR